MRCRPIVRKLTKPVDKRSNLVEKDFLTENANQAQRRLACTDWNPCQLHSHARFQCHAFVTPSLNAIWFVSRGLRDGPGPWWLAGTWLPRSRFVGFALGGGLFRDRNFFVLAFGYEAIRPKRTPTGQHYDFLGTALGLS